MLFNALVFWVFFPAFFVLYFATHGRARLWVCLAGSYLFYGWWDFRFLALIALLTGLNFACGLLLDGAQGDSKRRRRVLLLSIICSLGVLVFFKYTRFFLDSVVQGFALLGLEVSTPTLAIILPVGISFYTFQTMSYTIDLYRGQIEVERDWLRFAVFVAFFPQLVAGPIVRAQSFLPQLRQDARVDAEDLRAGLNQVLWGLMLKVVVADNLAAVADHGFRHPELHGGLFLSICVFFYTFQIYGDFAGYSLMAVGFARMLGLHFEQNFDRPYFATSFSEFWTRWHISLSSWLRDYLYIPLGGNRRSRTRTHGNLMTTMLLGGLWHGASWTFVFWGFLHGAFLVLQRVVAPLAHILPVPVRRATGWLAVLLGVMVGWVFFRAQTLNDATVVLGTIARGEGFQWSAVSLKFLVVKGLLVIAALWIVEWLSFRVDFPALLQRRVGLNVVACICALLVIAGAGMFGGTAFIYFQF